MLENNIKEKLLNKIIKEIKEQELYIKKCNEIDKKHYNMNVEINKLIEISEKLKKEDLSEEIDKDVIVIHNGNPYITYILAIKALCNQINMKICIDQVMLGTNLILIKLMEEVKKEINIKNKIEIIKKFDIELVKNYKGEKIIALGDKYPYNALLKENIEDIHYIAKYNVAMYILDEELEELKQNIINYCYNNFIEIEVYESENVEQAIEQIKIDNQGEKVMLLTNEKIDKEELKGIDISINQNILKNIEEKIIKERIL